MRGYAGVQRDGRGVSAVDLHESRVVRVEFERGAGIASAKLRDALKTISDLAESDLTGRAIDDPDIAMRMSEIEVDIDALEVTELRVLSALQTGQNPGAVSTSVRTTGCSTSASSRPARCSTRPASCGVCCGGTFARCRTCSTCADDDFASRPSRRSSRRPTES